jgi:hypothetical protein
MCHYAGISIAFKNAMSPVVHILTAVAPDTIERVRRILAGHELHVVRTINDARTVLKQERLALVFVGARFDDSQMFDLIDLVRNELAEKKIPIVAAIITPTKLSPNAIQGLGHSVKVFGASLFVNLNDFPDDPVGNARVRLIVDTCIAPPEAVEKLAPPQLRDPRPGPG